MPHDPGNVGQNQRVLIISGYMFVHSEIKLTHPFIKITSDYTNTSAPESKRVS